MFTLEIKINGSLIAHVYGLNVGETKAKLSVYNFEYYQPGDGTVYKGMVKHRREDGINKLIMLILDNVEKSKESRKVV